MINRLDKTRMVNEEAAIKGRDKPLPIQDQHFVLNAMLKPPYVQDVEKDKISTLIVGLGCFWGAEKKFWELDGVLSTAVGYSAGYTNNPTYEEVCSGMTGHNEVVLIVFDNTKTSLLNILICFWESHNPTQGMRQGNDVGTQYRSGIYTNSEAQMGVAKHSMETYQKEISSKGGPKITTEILTAKPFYYAEDYHQQYLAKNIGGYCGLGGTGVKFPLSNVPL